MTQPTPDEKTSREAWWYEAHEAERGRKRACLLSTHGLLLQYDAERAFCAGAWLSVIILAQAAIEATIRDVGTLDYKTSGAVLFGVDGELQRIRQIRNELVHPQSTGSLSKVWSVPNGDFVACHAALEETSKAAVVLMFRYMFAFADQDSQKSETGGEL